MCVCVCVCVYNLRLTYIEKYKNKWIFLYIVKQFSYLIKILYKTVYKKYFKIKI